LRVSGRFGCGNILLCKASPGSRQVTPAAAGIRRAWSRPASTNPLRVGRAKRRSPTPWCGSATGETLHPARRRQTAGCV